MHEPAPHPEPGSSAVPNSNGFAFRLLSRMTVSGNRAVFLARQDQPDREVVVKFASSSPEARREAWALGQLDHPRIPQLISTGTWPAPQNAPFVALDRRPGTPLDENLPAIEERALLTAARQICDALAHCHEQGVIHGDLKPRNVLLDAEAGASLIDFGSAISKEGHEAAKFTPDREGTELYMSPEVLSGAEPGPEADVFAVGLILYEGLAGRHPWEAVAANRLALTRHAAREEIPPLRRWSPASTGDLEAVVSAALAPFPQSRPSAHELRDDLGRLLDGLPVRARSASRLARTVWFLRARPTLAAALGLFAVALLVASTAVLVLRYRAQNDEQELLEQAEANEDLALLLIEDELELRTQSGTMETRRARLASAHAQLDLLPNTARRAAQRARLQVALGELARELDEHARAKALFEVARATWKQASETRTLSVEEELSSLLPQIHLGDLAFHASQLRDAWSLYEEVHRQNLLLADRPPEIVSVVSSLGYSFERLGCVALRLGNFDLARQSIDERLRLARRVLELDSNARGWLAIFNGHSLSSELAHRNHDQRTRLDHLRKALDAAKRVVATNPKDRYFRTRMITAQHSLLVQLIDYFPDQPIAATTRQMVSEVEAEAEALTESDPHYWAARLLRWRGSELRARILDRDEGSAASADELARGLARLRSPWPDGKGRPKDTSQRWEIASADLRVGWALSQSSQSSEVQARAEEHTTRALASLEELAATGEPQPGRIISVANSYLAASPEKLRRPRRALALAERAVELGQRQDFRHLEALARAQEACGQPEAAKRTRAEAKAQLESGQKLTSQ